MKTQQTFLFIALLISSLGIIAGCEEDSIFGDPPSPWIRSVHVIMEEDTVRFLPNDSVAVDGSVIVEDRMGCVLPAIHVDVTLSSFGYIELTDTTLRDTTNEFGRVEFTFHSFNDTGNVVISACVADITASCSLYVSAAD